MASINPTRRVLVAGLALAGLGLGPARAAPEWANIGAPRSKL